MEALFYIYTHTTYNLSISSTKRSRKTKTQDLFDMKMTENKQRRLRHYMEAPRRFLRRARDFYVDSLVTFDSKVGIVTCSHTANTSKNFDSNRRRKHDDEDKLEEMYRSMCSSMELDRVGCLRERGRGGYGGIYRSYSVALGKIGTIDEDEQCEFQENVALKSDHMFLRTRSHAVTRNFDFH